MKLILCTKQFLFATGIFILVSGCCKKEEDIPPISFNPSITYGSLTDQDGNKYKTVVIGTQEWMAENLKTTRYRNGDLLPQEPDAVKWEIATSGAYCFYDNEEKYISAYGFLYNHYAVIDSRNLAPDGWHVATYSDWSTLVDYLGGNDIACIKLRETGASHWINSNNTTNASGFTALPGGYRFKWQIISGRAMEYGLLGSDGNWWGYDGVAWISSFQVILTQLDGSENKHYGMSVRCVKD